MRRLGEAIEPAALARLEKEVEDEIAAAFAFAEASPFPEPEELLRDVFKEDQHDEQIAGCRSRIADYQWESTI
jgi:TPP-dependent pyruvate/acetoin dehydrogenase alpha subunit